MIETTDSGGHVPKHRKQKRYPLAYDQHKYDGSDPDASEES